MQGQGTPKVVPRVLFELDQAGLMQLLTQPGSVVDLLVSLCRQERFDGLVSRQAAVSSLTSLTCFMCRSTSNVSGHTRWSHLYT